jgi:hypothetical protein
LALARRLVVMEEEVVVECRVDEGLKRAIRRAKPQTKSTRKLQGEPVRQ